MAGGPLHLCYRCRKRLAKKRSVLCPGCRERAARDRVQRVKDEKRRKFGPTKEGVERYERAVRRNVFGWPDRSI